MSFNFTYTSFKVKSRVNTISLPKKPVYFYTLKLVRHQASSIFKVEMSMTLSPMLLFEFKCHCKLNP